MYDSPASLIGKEIDQFRLDQFIARGAMGMVFKGFDTTLLRTVAIKLIAKGGRAEATREELATHEEARKRLILEAKAAGRLTHPNIVTIYCYGETPDFVYLCMEYVSGRTLAQILNAQKVLSVDEALIIFDQILQALELAGQEEIVHRDIKPSNIMITDDNRVKVMDFGIAKLPSLSLTTVGTVLGTPHYMSPEQISGQAVDVRSDIFSVGAVLYEALTGERPFSAESTAALIYKILQVDPIPPRVLNIHVPEPVGDIMKKALAKDPANRFQTPGEMLGTIRAVLQLRMGLAGALNGTTIVRKDLLGGETLQFMAEERLAAATPIPPSPGAPSTVPETPAKERVPPPARTEAPPVKDEGKPKSKPSAAPGQAKDSAGGARRGVVSAGLKNAERPLPKARIPGGLAVLLAVVVAGGIVLWRLFPTPSPPVSLPLAITPGTLPEASQNATANGQPRSPAEVLVEQAKGQWEGDPGAAQKLLEEAVVLDPNSFEATFQLARLLTFKKDFPAAVQQYQNAIRINNQAPDAFFNLGYIFLSQGAIDQAIENYEAARSLAPPYLDEILTNLAVCYWKKNDPTQARGLFKQALDLNPNNELARNYLNTLEKSLGAKK